MKWSFTIVFIHLHLYSATIKLPVPNFCKRDFKLRESSFLPIPLCVTLISLLYACVIYFIWNMWLCCCCWYQYKKLCCAFCVSLRTPQSVQYPLELVSSSQCIVFRRQWDLTASHIIDSNMHFCFISPREVFYVLIIYQKYWCWCRVVSDGVCVTHYLCSWNWLPTLVSVLGRGLHCLPKKWMEYCSLWP